MRYGDIPVNQRWGTVFANNNYAGTQTSADMTNPGARGLALFLNVGTISASGTISVQVEDKDPVAGTYDQLVNTADVTANWITATGRKTVVIYPGATETSARANYIYQGVPLPRIWRAKVLDTAGGTWSYSLGYEYLP